MKRTNLFYTPVLGIAAASLFSILHPAAADALNLTMSEGASAARGAGQAATLFGATGVFTSISNVMLFIVGAISVIMIVIGGLRYVISGGSTSNVASAKNTILYAVVGLVISMLAYAIINFVITSFLPGTDIGATNV